jgi:hypothetical protein
MKWKLHQIVKARVTEIQRDESLVVSFHGELLRVRNQSDRKFQLGQEVSLEVVALRPVKFRLVTASNSRSSFRVSV